MKNYYQILGLETNASLNKIKKRYKKLAIKYHPDLNDSKSKEELFKQITEAYVTLKDQKLRLEYDHQFRISRNDQNLDKGQEEIIEELLKNQKPLSFIEAVKTVAFWYFAGSLILGILFLILNIITKFWFIIPIIFIIYLFI